MRAVIAALLIACGASAQNLAVQGKTVYTMAGAAIQDGIVLIENGKITRVGPAAQVKVPSGYQNVSVVVLRPGLVEADPTLGWPIYLNIPNNQDQVERRAG